MASLHALVRVARKLALVFGHHPSMGRCLGSVNARRISTKTLPGKDRLAAAVWSEAVQRSPRTLA